MNGTRALAKLAKQKRAAPAGQGAAPPHGNDSDLDHSTKTHDATAPTRAEDGRLLIEDGPDLHVIVDAMASALERDSTVFVRDGTLGRVLPPSSGELARWRAFRPASLREAVGRQARFYRFVRSSSNPGAPERRFILPPESACQALADRSTWPNLRSLRRIAYAPFLRADGTVCQSPGFDPSSGIFAAFDRRAFDRVPASPTRDDARAALAELAAVFVDFPFKSKADRFVPVALLLSLVGREAILGPVPLTMLSATVKGTGKSKLADVVSIIATGRPTPGRAAPRTDEEWPKALLALAREAPPLVNFDNLDNGKLFGHPALDSMLTSGAIAGRALGSNENIIAEVHSVFVASCNNPRYGSDLSRRVLPCRLETTLERPEERTDFQIPNIEEHARGARRRLLAAALTILAAFEAAGRPGPGRMLGGFERWSELVCGSIRWAGGPDVLDTRGDIDMHDEERGVLDVFLCACEEVFRADPFTARDVISRFQVGGEREEALTTFCPRIGGAREVTSRSLGRRLAGIKGRIVKGRRLVVRGETNGSILWALEHIG